MMQPLRQPPGRYNRELVVAKVKKFFPNENPDKILAILDLYGDRPEKHRVHVAIIKMSEGNIERLKECVATAIFDYRDVVGAAEYEEDWLMRDPTISHLNKPEE